MGPAGEQGPPGESVQIVGQVATSSALPAITPDPAIGDGYIATDTGHLWVFTGPAPNSGIGDWTDVGDIVGPAGPTGPRGSLWYSASGVPGVISGVAVADHYLDVATGNVYEWVA